ncbi:MAG TPA: FAD-dependent oxidoreductase [Solirubrobacteraceae bacterium]|jgi:NADPH-dependent 2,4-dienoyl-CoA reductase/sulfur reductase-like enzyme
MTRIVIAGAGLAGLRAAQAARAAGHEGEIVLIGDEPHPPYTRPPLSKELLKGEQTAEGCAFPGLDKLDAELRLSTAISAVDADAHTVTLGDGGSLDYGRLILATGVRARALPHLTGGHTLRDLADAVRLGDALAHTRRLAIVGAGFIGCEVAASARHRGIDVALIDLAPQPLLPLGPELGARCAQLHRDRGVDLHLGVGIDGIDDGGVQLDDGTKISADLVLIAVGAQPNTEFLAGSPIELAPDGGVVCDATLTSVSDPDVLAAGDIASWPHAGAGGERVRVEHWTTAAEHGRLAGANATKAPAERVPHVAPPYFWSDQYELKIQSVGFPARAALIEIVEEDGESGRLIAEALGEDGELVGAVAFNNARRLAEYRRRLAVEHA